jgi:hypothetical protein
VLDPPSHIIKSYKMGGGASASLQLPDIDEVENTKVDVIAVACSQKHLDGSTYQGDYINGLMHGKGRLVLTNGDVYQGSFADNEIHGQGRMTFSSLDISNSTGINHIFSDVESWYEGAWEHGQKNGNGIFHYPNGDIYVGMFKDGNENGHGAKEFSNGNSYVGQWVNGKIGGHGKYMYSDGDEYEVTFDADGNRICGSFTFADGKKYEGDFGDKSVAKWIDEQFLTSGLRSNARLIFALRAQIVQAD